MNDPAAIDRLLPCLLDRLTDDDPTSQRTEGRMHRVMSMKDFRASVARDLQWLLSAGPPPRHNSIHDYPEANRSVVNFGVQSLGGYVDEKNSLRLAEIQAHLRSVILQFEPRLLPHTLEVRVEVASDDKHHTASPKVLAMVVKGELWSHSMPEPFLFKTEVDLGDSVLA